MKHRELSKSILLFTLIWGSCEVVLRSFWGWFEPGLRLLLNMHDYISHKILIGWILREFTGSSQNDQNVKKKPSRSFWVNYREYIYIYMFSDYLIEGVQSRLWGGRRVKNGKTSPQNPLGRPVAPSSENWGLFGAFRGAFEAILRSSWGPNSIEVILRDCLFSFLKPDSNQTQSSLNTDNILPQMIFFTENIHHTILYLNIPQISLNFSKSTRFWYRPKSQENVNYLKMTSNWFYKL